MKIRGEGMYLLRPYKILCIYMSFQTYDSSDYLQVFMGTGYGGYHKLHFHTSHSVPYSWDMSTEFIAVFWHSNHYGNALGFKATVSIEGSKYLFIKAAFIC